MNSEVASRLEEVMNRGIEEKEIAGMNFLVLKEGQEALYLEGGYADREKGRKISRDTIFRLYSMTKPVTAAAVMILFERGLIDLTEPVEKYIPGFQNQTVAGENGLEPVCSPVTIQQLLSMTSGLPYGDSYSITGRYMGELFQEMDTRLYSENPMTTQEFADRSGRIPLEFQPGTAWKYGVSADILGAVVEQAAHMRFGEFLQKEIFEPLGMKDTGFYVPKEKRDRLALAYEREETFKGQSQAESICGKSGRTEWTLKPFTGNHLGILNKMDRQPAFESGGAGLVSTVDDYANFARMLMDGGRFGKKQILLPETVRFMTSRKLTAQQQCYFDKWVGLNGYTYGNLMRIMQDEGQAHLAVSAGEYGWDGWLGCYFSNLPKEKMTILLMTQMKDAGTMPVTRKMRNVLLLGMPF